MNFEQLCIIGLIIGIIILAAISAYSAFLPTADDDHHEGLSHD